MSETASPQKRVFKKLPQARKDVYMPQKLATISTYPISTTQPHPAEGRHSETTSDTKARRKHPTPHIKTPEKK
jgi:hypothetical protein